MIFTPSTFLDQYCAAPSNGEGGRFSCGGCHHRDGGCHHRDLQSSAANAPVEDGGIAAVPSSQGQGVGSPVIIATTVAFIACTLFVVFRNRGYHSHKLNQNDNERRRDEGKCANEKKRGGIQSRYVAPKFLFLLLSPRSILPFANLYTNERIAVTFFAASMCAWIAVGSVSAGHTIYVPVPMIGYFRIDLAIAIIVVEMPLLCWLMLLRKRKLFQFAVMTFLLFGLPMLPDFVRPLVYLVPLQSGQYGSKVETHKSVGFSREEANTLLHDVVWQHRDKWTHISESLALGYFKFGVSLAFDAKTRFRDKLNGYTFKYGRRLTTERMKRESDYKLYFPQDGRHVQRILYNGMARKLRLVYARTLNVTPEDVVFGNEIRKAGISQRELGQPSIGITLPNLLFHWIVNPHVDYVFENRITTATIPCQKSGEVIAVMIPLAAPPGSGLAYWTNDNGGSFTRHDIYYEVGNTYVFNATGRSPILHDIRPWPYREWGRGSARIVVQSNGVQCDDGKWYFYH